MLLASYLAVLEVLIGEESNSSLFDQAAFLYIYLEPTISGTIVLLAFIHHRKYLIRSFDIIHKILKTLERQGCTVSVLYIKIQTNLFLAVFLVGNLLWNIHSYLNGKSKLHSFYEYLGWGISFHAQHVVLIYFVVHIKISQIAARLLNERLQAFQMGDDDAMVKFAKIGAMHFELCRAVAYMGRICTPTTLLFSIRTYFVLCCSLLSLNGMLPTLKVDFFILALIYLTTTVHLVLRNETVHREVRWL